MKLSIITINLNNCEGFRKTAESVVCQTFTDYEWIVIDGGSTDGSRELIEQYADNIAYWVSEPDKGIYNAMNKGILAAKGEYCLFLNSGDRLADRDVLTKFFTFCPTEDVVYGYIVRDYGNHIEVCGKQTQFSLRTFIVGSFHHSGNSFIRRDAFDKWGFYDESLKIVSDWKWFLKVLGLGTASARFLDVNTSIIDPYGVSETSVEIKNKEIDTVLKEEVPDRILSDYLYFREMESEKNMIESIIRSSLSYRIGHFLTRPFKCIKRWVL